LFVSVQLVLQRNDQFEGLRGSKNSAAKARGSLSTRFFQNNSPEVANISFIFLASEIV